MAGKTTIRSMRFTDEMMEVISSQIGDTFTEKFEGLVRRCVFEGPEAERELRRLNSELDRVTKLLEERRREARELQRISSAAPRKCVTMRFKVKYFDVAKERGVMTKKQHDMTEKERYRLEGMLRAKMPKTQIAMQLGFSRQTIYNEIERGTYMHTVKWYDVPRYSAEKGQRVAEARQKNKGRPLKIGHDHEYAEFLDRQMHDNKRSPAAALAEARKAGFATELSVGTVYNYIDRGFFLRMDNEDLWEKTSRAPRNKKKPKIAHETLPSIEDRPEYIGDRSENGHWEGDLIVGGKGTTAVLLTLTERRKREEIIIKLCDRKAATVREAFDRLERKYGKETFREKFKSVTFDNGSEFMEYEKLITSVYGGKRFDVYYTHAGAPYEKGGNENHNRMIRRFFPKGTDFGKVSKKRIAEIQDWMNGYPRKVLNWLTPNELSDL